VETPPAGIAIEVGFKVAIGARLIDMLIGGVLGTGLGMLLGITISRASRSTHKATD
jgi:hypothetical protein